MSAFPAIEPARELEAPAQRYEALLRAANSIASCSDCDTAADTLVKELREVIAFDYLQLIAFESGTDAVAWHLLYLNGERQKSPLTEAFPEGTPMRWVYEYQQLLATANWNEETQFPRHGSFLRNLGIASTCTLPLARGSRRLGVLGIGSIRPRIYSGQEK